MISVLILTKNEEQNLPGCLESVAWSDDIHIYDAYSTDKTVEIAEAAGAKIARKSAYAQDKLFGGNEAEYRNWGLRTIPFKYPWVIQLDADERVTPELHANIELALKVAGNYVAYRIQRRDFFCGTWLKHVQVTPYYVRLFRPEKMRYERLVNPVSIPDGPVGEVKGYLDHFPFSKGGISYWFDRHNAYSSLEAQQILNNRSNNERFSLRKAFFESDFHKKRYHQKELFYRLPARPLIKFMLLYFLKRGFLDGRAGFTYSVLQSIYEYMIVLKSREMDVK